METSIWRSCRPQNMDFRTIQCLFTAVRQILFLAQGNRVASLHVQFNTHRFTISFSDYLPPRSVRLDFSDIILFSAIQTASLLSIFLFREVKPIIFQVLQTRQLFPNQNHSCIPRILTTIVPILSEPHLCVCFFFFLSETCSDFSKQTLSSNRT